MVVVVFDSGRHNCMFVVEMVAVRPMPNNGGIHVDGKPCGYGDGGGGTVAYTNE
jgi:hypothetical protein